MRTMYRWAALLLILVLLAACAVPESFPTVTLIADGETRTFSTNALTVRDLLAEAGVVLDEDDRVEPVEPTFVEDGMTVRVIRVEVHLETEQREIPFERRTVREASLPEGETRLLEPGVTGLEEFTYRITVEDGVQVERKLIRRSILQEPRAEVVLIGVQPELKPVPITGTVAYIANHNAWVMQTMSPNVRRLTHTGDLDGRVFSLSPDGTYLLFTRSSAAAIPSVEEGESASSVGITATVTATATLAPGEEGSGITPTVLATSPVTVGASPGKGYEGSATPRSTSVGQTTPTRATPGTPAATRVTPTATATPTSTPVPPTATATALPEEEEEPTPFNTLWMIETATVNAEPVRLQVENVLWADWAPDCRRTPTGRSCRIAYSTGTPIEGNPDWKAENDLWIAWPRAQDGQLLSERQVVEPSAGGAYGWWGTTYAWAPNGQSLAYARADEVGVIRVVNGARTVLVRFAPYRTFAPWVWTPTISWSLEGKFIATTLHGPAPTGGDPEDSPVFDVWALAADGTITAELASEAGMWAAPAYAPKGDLVVFGRARSPYVSQTSGYDLYLMDRDGSDRQRIFPPEDEVGLDYPEVAWGPGGDRLLVVYRGGLYLITMADGEVHQLVHEGDVAAVRWRW